MVKYNTHITDPDSPLKDVGMLIKHGGSGNEPPQMWANISESTSPMSLDLDVTSSKTWRPFFGKGGGGFRVEQIRDTQLPDNVSPQYFADVLVEFNELIQDPQDG